MTATAAAAVTLLLLLLLLWVIFLELFHVGPVNINWMAEFGFYGCTLWNSLNIVRKIQNCHAVDSVGLSGYF